MEERSVGTSSSSRSLFDRGMIRLLAVLLGNIILSQAYQSEMNSIPYH